MDNKICRECLYYNGNIRPTHDKNTNIVEQCGKQGWEERGLEHHVKHGKSKYVICAAEYDYHYKVMLLDGEYNRFERVQITKEEYDSFYEWEGDALKVNEIKDRKLGCDACRNPAMISPEICLDKIGESTILWGKLWKCKECGTLWEYGVYNNEIVDPSYAEHYYNVNLETD